MGPHVQREKSSHAGGVRTGGRGFEPNRGHSFFLFLRVGPFLFLVGLTLRRNYLGYLLEHFNLPYVNNYISFMSVDQLIVCKKNPRATRGFRCGKLKCYINTPNDTY